MSTKQGAYGARAGDTDFRKKWDKEEYAEKARQRDQEEKERMQENEERMKQGAQSHMTCILQHFIDGRVIQVRSRGREGKMTCRSLRSS